MNETGKWSCTVREAELPVLSNEACRNTNYNATKIKEVMMCAGFPETAHKDACTVSRIVILENYEFSLLNVSIIDICYLYLCALCI